VIWDEEELPELIVKMGRKTADRAWWMMQLINQQQ